MEEFCGERQAEARSCDVFRRGPAEVRHWVGERDCAAEVIAFA